MSKYSVVEFIEEEGSLFVVPNDWIDFSSKPLPVCFWPPFKSYKKVQEASIANKPVQPNWTQHKIKHMCYSRSYRKAALKMKRFAISSDVEPFSDSDVENQQQCSATYSISNISKSQEMSPYPHSAKYKECCRCCCENKAALKTILTRLNDLKEQTLENTMLMQRIVGTDVVVTSGDISVDNLSDLEKLNKKLESSEEFKRMVKVLCNRGGKDPIDCTRRILSCLITTNLAKQLNWIGGKNKTSIQRFHLVLQLIYVAFQQDAKFATTTQAVIEDAIKRWLRTACDRDGGRTLRRK